MSFNLNDYVDVKTRIALFHQMYPHGSLQFKFQGICQHDPDYIWGIAYAFRFPEDIKPGIGTAQELAIGRTNFTKGSTLQNLESSCWGRAIASLGIGIDVSVASRDEVEAAQATESSKPVYKGSKQGKPFAQDPASEAQRKLIQRLMPGPAWIEEWKAQHGIVGAVNKLEASAIIEELQALQPIVKVGGQSTTVGFERSTDGD
jgi:hypothetical protein